MCMWPMRQQNHRKTTNTQKTPSDGNRSTMIFCKFVYLCIHQQNHSLKLPVPKVTANGFNMLPTNNSYSSTSNPHCPSHRAPSTGHDDRQVAGGETPLSKTRWGGIRRAVVQSSSPRPSPSPATPELTPRPRDPVPGPAATAAALLFLPPALSLVHPALYLPASILVLLTPARNSASLPVPAPPPVSPQQRQRRQ